MTGRHAIRHMGGRRAEAGFTLSELLGAVGVLVIMFALLVPAIFALRRDLRQTELDTKAETVYVAVQNRLTKLRSGGNIKSYAKQGQSAPHTKVLALPSDPSDRNGEVDENGDPVDSSELCYMTYLDMTSSGTAAYVVMSKGATDEELRLNRWVVEFDPAGASVYAVWYSEGERLDDYADAWDEYDTLRYRAQRLIDGARVGYYGGDSESAQTGLQLRPVISVTNKEKLSVTMQCSSPGKTSDAPALLFDVTLSDGAGHSVTKTYSYTGLNHLERLRRNYYLTLTLDDLSEQATRFDYLYGTHSGQPSDQCLLPGLPLTITLRVYSENQTIVPKTISTRTNGLFADASTTDTAVIEYGRHLQNLSVLESASYWTVPKTVTHAVQTRDISFRESDDEGSWHAAYGASGTTYFNGRTKGKATNFEPVDPSALTSYDGGGHVISGLAMEGSGDMGLFKETPDGMTIADVRLVGASVASTGGFVGALVGSASGTLGVTGCSAYLSSSAGDLTGRNQGTPFLSGTDAGGLVGHVETDAEVTIDKSFASTILSGTAVAGGLVGTVDGTVTVTKSYADGYVTGKAAAGLVGKVATAGTASLTDCYAAGYVYPKETGAGLATGTVTSATNAYTICSMDERTSHNHSTATGITHASKVYYAQKGSSEGDDLAGTTPIGDMSDAALAEQLGGAFEIAPTKTHTYRLLGQSITQYEHPKLKANDHYGDWEAQFQSGAIVYYEQYSGGSSYGFFGAGAVSTLSDSKPVTGDGYGLVYRRSDLLAGLLPTNVKVTLLGQTYEFDPSSDSVPRHVIRASDGQDYVLYPFPTTMLNRAPTGSSFYSEVKVSGTGHGGTETVESFYLNPHFAMTAGNVTGSEGIPQVPNDDVAYVRTPRHLLSLSLHHDAYAPSIGDCTFTQLRDIDYGTYDWDSFYEAGTQSVTEQGPIGMGGDDHTPFTSAYDGQGHIVRGVSFISEDGYFIGFVGMNEGDIENVVLWSDYDPDAPSNNIRRQSSLGTNEHVYMGVLAGYNAEGATIRNCAVAGYYLAGADGTIYAYANSHLYGGGLVGGNEGAISNCSTDCPTIRLSTLNADVHVGGLVGYNFSDGTVTNSYAIGHIDVAWAIGGSVEIAGFAGENEGALSDSYCCVSMTSNGTVVSAHAFAPVEGSTNRCYYLDDGTYLYAGTLQSYNRSGTTTGDPISRLDLIGRWSSKADASHTLSYMDDKDGETYPFRAVVRAGDGRLAHYGDWQSDAVLGRLGLFYWEKEEGGTNDGYHFSYIGVHDGSTIAGSTLCGAHDDGGVIRRYGYGYLIERGETELGTVTQRLSGIENSGSVIDAEAKDSLEAQMPNYAFYPYVTTTGDDDCYIRLEPGNDVRDGTWELEFDGADGPRTYEFTVSPFFANAMSYGDAGEVTGADGSVSDYAAEPGSQANAYEVRSIDQLQYINWNGTSLDTETVVNPDTYLQFPYLQHATSLATGKQTKAEIVAIRPEQFWNQTHDVYGYAGMTSYTPIAPLATNSGYQSYNSVLCAWFGGTYDGQSYKMGNFDIISDCFSVGVFGQTVGANMRNIILYSNQGNTVERVTDQGGQVGEMPGAYGLGGIVGIAYDYNLQSSTNVIENCAVAGYRIIDRSTNRHTLGGANIGGLAGITGVNLEKCSAVTDIDIRCTHANGDSAYGSYIHVGGLCGAVRYRVTDCYTGGTIHIDDDGPESTMYEMFSDNNGTRDYNFTGTKNRNFATHIYVGGIGGSAFTVDYVNFTGSTSTSAWNLSEPVYTRCYTYTRLPDIENNVRGVALIGSVADRYGQNKKKVVFDQCYCLQSVVDEISYTKTPYHFIVNANDVGLTDAEFQAILNGDMQAMKHIVYNDTSANTTPVGVPNRISYAGLQGLAPVLGGDWGMVTTTEGNEGFERSIPGKYSFPGDHAELLGRNYPFPTIVTQPDLTFNRKVNVHYGEWPSDGIYWDEGIASIDIFRDHGTKTFTLRDEKGLIVGIPDITIDDPSIATMLGSPRPTSNGYEVTIVAQKEGATNITASSGTNTASFVLDVTAKLSVSCNPAEVQAYSGDTSRVALTAASSLDPSQVYTTSGTWSVSSSRYSDIDIQDGTIVVTHDEAGYEELSVLFVYERQGQEYKASMFLPIRTFGTVGLGTDPSLGDGVARFSQATRQHDAGVVDGATEIGSKIPALPAGSVGEMFLYESRSDSEHHGTGISGLRVTSVRFDYDLPDGTQGTSTYSGTGEAISVPDEGIGFITGFESSVVSDSSYDYLPGTALYAGSVPISNCSVTVTATHDEDAGTLYQMSMDVSLPNKVVAFDANGGTGRMAPIRTSDDSILVPECTFEMEGYKFAGWTIDGTDTIMPGDELPLEASITLIAQWEPITYYILFDGNYATSGEMDDLTCAYDETVELPECGFACEGMLFVGWATSPTGPVAYADQDSVTNLSSTDGETVPLFAKWVPIYVLTLDGAYLDADPTYQEFDVISGQTSTLEGYVTPTRGMYELAGWATERDGTTIVLTPDGAIADDVPGYTSNGAFEMSQDRTLYAIWAEPVTLVSNGESTEYAYSMLADEYVAPETDNGTLDGWYRREDDGETYAKCLNPDGTPVDGYELTPGDVLYAKWAMTKQVLREDWTPNGSKWTDVAEIDLAAGEYLEATMDISTCQLMNQRENILGFGQDIAKWEGCYGMQFYFAPTSATQGYLRPTVLAKKLVDRRDITMTRDRTLTLTLKADEFLIDGQRDTDALETAYANLMSTLIDNTTWQVGSAEGNYRSYASNYTIKIMYDTIG